MRRTATSLLCGALCVCVEGCVWAWVDGLGGRRRPQTRPKCGHDTSGSRADARNSRFRRVRGVAVPCRRRAAEKDVRGTEGPAALQSACSATPGLCAGRGGGHGAGGEEDTAGTTKPFPAAFLDMPIAFSHLRLADGMRGLNSTTQRTQKGTQGMANKGFLGADTGGAGGPACCTWVG